MSKRIGMIGLGVMGAPMARQLLEKFGSLTVLDIDPGKTESFSKDNANIVSSPLEVGESSQLVVLSLPTSDAVKSVILAEDGLIHGMKAGGTIIDCSTTDPAITRGIAAELAEQKILFLDAPVSGGQSAAIDGTLSIMVGGDEKVFEESLEVLETIGTTVTRVGDIGMGQVTKLINNMIVAAAFAIIAEGFALGAKSGLDAKSLYQAIRNGWAGSRILDVSVPAILEHNFKPGGTIDLHYKDLNYALELANQQDVPVPVTTCVHEIFKAARAAGKGPMAQPVLITLWEELMKMEVR